MTTPDVPAERDKLPSVNDLREWAGRWLDEHRAEAAQSRRYAALLRSPEAPDDPLGTAEESEADAESADAEAAMYAAILALLAQQEAQICLQCIERAEQEIAAGHYYRANELIAALRERREPVCACGETHPDRTPLAAARPAPEAREPDGWAIRMRDGSWRSTIYEDRETAERKAVKAREFFAARGDEDDEFDSIDVLPVYLGTPAPAEATEASAPEPKGLHVYGNILPPDAPEALHVTLAPASGEPSGAEAAVREALDAIKKAHAAVDDLCNGRRWTMSVPARPDADPDLVIGDALTKAERVIRSLTDVPTAPGAPEEGAGDAE